METPFSRMQAVQSPIIPVVGELIRNSPGTISLGQGVVYYPPPREAFDMIPQFLADPNQHKYKAVEGIAPLREAIAAKLEAENQIPIDEDNCIVVTAGGNMAFMNAILAITSPGDEIIIQTPYYFNHEMAIAIASCKAVLVGTDENYQLRPQAIADAMTEKTKAVVTISPNNPTGVVYPESTLRQVNELCQNHDIYHIHDEAYEYFTYGDAQHFSPGSIASSRDRTISLFSLSKAYGFASWRIGYMVIPSHLLVPVKKIQDTILICPAVISQWAALGALKLGRAYCEEKIKAISEVREIVLDALSELTDFCTIPEANGAFYCFLKTQTALPPMEVVERLIKEYKVAAIPGTTFGLENGCYLRVAYGALEKETAAEGINRLVRGLKAIVRA
ncbi:pyridoxal phosphate-dependent aminotransferase [Phormidium sp. CCY1219]|uniref:pyridoxal phosphate-dependent aminotransferase n=1 Tax=Phormidium sp. CCY1219 TaxID=2886104 RepID=UPI002D1EBFD5|nr:pyridoxal phosphate-dependent aminotransferase [Phormidium sp. CCY1219]MEB3828655.1 pyridoxal phosphate-dependent aminotransferase [Phormidium sp. CCY1219]